MSIPANPGSPFKTVVSVGKRKLGSANGKNKEESQNSAARAALASIAPHVEKTKAKLENDESLDDAVVSVFNIAVKSCKF